MSLDFINEQSIKSKNEQTKINEDNKNISLLIKENEEYKNIVVQLENCINELEIKIKVKDNIIKEQRLKIEKLSNKLKEYENNSNNYSVNGRDRILELENELNIYKSYFLSEGEKLISVQFISTDQIINNFRAIAKNTDKFSKLEDLLYEKYPNYKDTENYFIVNGNKINRNRTLEENKIKNNDVLTLSTIDF